jgi:hypothetical protein
MKALINTFTLVVFLLGTLQFSNVVSFCKMSQKMDVDISCVCSTGDEHNEVSISGVSKCCTVKKFEKENVQDFASFKDNVSKLISNQITLKSEIINLPFNFSPKIITAIFISPPRSDIPILNSSLLI